MTLNGKTIIQFIYIQYSFYWEMFLRIGFTIFCLATVIQGIPIDNGVEGEPEIECGPTSITVNFNTRNPFEGHIFVKGLYSDPNCRREETGGRSIAGIELPFDTCNVQRTRSLNPRGIFVSTTVVISFHPQFVTKVDRVYRLQCFYMEADKTVSTDLHVSEMTTLLETTIVPMPICRYELHEGGPEGPLIKYGLIGQQVYHRWVCDTETQDTYCMIVNTCTVDDGQGEKIQILDQKGCALDKYVLNNLEYPTDLSAGQEAHIYKFADRPDLFYQCQIAITIKEPNAECARPECAEPEGFNTVRLTGELPPGNPNPSHEGANEETEGGNEENENAPPAPVRGGGRRTRRQADFDRSNTVDVRAEMSALNLMDEDEAKSLEATLGKETSHSRLPSGHQIVYRSLSEGYCLSPFSISFLVFGSFLLLGIIITYRFSTKVKSFKE